MQTRQLRLSPIIGRVKKPSPIPLHAFSAGYAARYNALYSRNISVVAVRNYRYFLICSLKLVW